MKQDDVITPSPETTTNNPDDNAVAVVEFLQLGTFYGLGIAVFLLGNSLVMWSIPSYKKFFRRKKEQRVSQLRDEQLEYEACRQRRQARRQARRDARARRKRKQDAWSLVGEDNNSPSSVSQVATAAEAQVNSRQLGDVATTHSSTEWLDRLDGEDAGALPPVQEDVGMSHSLSATNLARLAEQDDLDSLSRRSLDSMRPNLSHRPPRPETRHISPSARNLALTAATHAPARRRRDGSAFSVTRGTPGRSRGAAPAKDAEASVPRLRPRRFIRSAAAASRLAARQSYVAARKSYGTLNDARDLTMDMSDKVNMWTEKRCSTILRKFGIPPILLYRSKTSCGAGCGDTSWLMTAWNVVTSYPFWTLGNVLHDADRTKSTHKHADWASKGVCMGSMIFHASRGDWRIFLRKADYIFISCASYTFVRGIQPPEDGKHSWIEKIRRSRIFSGMNHTMTIFEPLITSFVNILVIQVSLVERMLSTNPAVAAATAAAAASCARSEEHLPRPRRWLRSLRRVWSRVISPVFGKERMQTGDVPHSHWVVHGSIAILGGVCFFIEDFFPSGPVHGLWHLLAWAGSRTAAPLLRRPSQPSPASTNAS